MSKEIPKEQPKKETPDDLTKTTRKANLELREQELEKASGGCGTGMSKGEAI